MNRRSGFKMLATGLAGLSLALLASCALAPGEGYGSVSVNADYYQPFAGDYGYGVWGPDFQVGPYRGGGGRVGGGRPEHGYRPAAPGRAVPSLPSRSRPGRGGSPARKGP